METYKHSRNVLGISEPEYGYHLNDISEFIEHEKRNHLAELITRTREKNNFVGFVGGPPCPDFSVGGKSRGSKGENDREKVFREASKKQFESLNARYFSYSAVEEMYALFKRRKIRGITEEFLDSYMEPVLAQRA